MIAGSACGQLIPAYVVYKAYHLWHTWTLGGRLDIRYNRSKSGWIDRIIFRVFVFCCPLPYLRKRDGKKLLNLSSHIDLEIVSACIKNDTQFVFPTPNSKHVCQPLNVAFFKSMKLKWRAILTDWKMGSGRHSATMSKDHFPKCLESLLEAIEPNCNPT